MRKPKILYHASDNSELEIIEPARRSFRRPEEGPLVFATPDMRVASMFIARLKSNSVQISKFGDQPVFICSDQAGFEAADRGGAIYSLSTELFTNDPEKGMGEGEWTSKQLLKPVARQTYQSAFQAMRNLGVKIYFVDRETLKKIQTAKDHGWSIIQRLKPTI